MNPDTSTPTGICAPAPRSWRRWCWMLAILIAGKVLYMAFFLTPPGDMPDESGHYSYVRDIAHGKFFPLLGEATIPKDLWFDRLPEPERSTTSEDQLLDLADTADGDQPSVQLSDLSRRKPRSSSRPNYIVQHPPLYYIAAAIPFAVAEQLTSDRWYHIRATRIVSALSLGLLVVVLFSTMGDLGVSPARALPLAAAVGFIPMISHLSSGITNDIFLFLMCALATRYLVRFLLAHRMPDAYLCALWLTLAGGTKMTAWPMIAGFLAIMLYELRQPLRRWFLHAGGITLVTLVLPMWWALRNVYYFGNPMQINVVTNPPLFLNYTVIDYLKAQPFLDWMMVHSYGLIGFAGFCQNPRTMGDCVGVHSTRIGNQAFEFVLLTLAVMAAAMVVHTLYHYVRQFRSAPPATPMSIQGWVARAVRPGWARGGLLVLLGAAGILLYAWAMINVHREGELGWIINTVALSAIVVALFGTGIALFDDQGSRRFVYYALALFFCYGLLIAYQSHKAYVLVAELRGVQGRYFYPFLPMLFASIALVLERLRVPAFLLLWMSAGFIWGELHSYIDQVIPFFEAVRI
ncbi:MAG: DUF2142 domain-containing protein [Burkholderiaceae bacterium]